MTTIAKTLRAIKVYVENLGGRVHFDTLNEKGYVLYACEHGESWMTKLDDLKKGVDGRLENPGRPVKGCLACRKESRK